MPDEPQLANRVRLGTGTDAHGVTDVVSLPTNAGVELAVLCVDTAAASAFISQVTAALATPVAERDDALPVVLQHLAALRFFPMAPRCCTLRM